jgi:hypothetical protein
MHSLSALPFVSSGSCKSMRTSSARSMLTLSRTLTRLSCAWVLRSVDLLSLRSVQSYRSRPNAPLSRWALSLNPNSLCAWLGRRRCRRALRIRCIHSLPFGCRSIKWCRRRLSAAQTGEAFSPYSATVPAPSDSNHDAPVPSRNDAPVVPLLATCTIRCDIMRALRMLCREPTNNSNND